MLSNCMIAVYATTGLFALCLLKVYFRLAQVVSLPPGPKGLPLVGNLCDMPAEKEWLTFARWGEKYGIFLFYQVSRFSKHSIDFAGDICSVTVLGQTLVILNSAKAASDMLDKKSAIYSDRPVLQMGGELVGWKNTMVLLPYSDRFRRYRRLFHSLIGTPSAVKRFHPSEEIETRQFLRRVLMNPDDVSSHVRKWGFITVVACNCSLTISPPRTAGAVILRISHGYEVKEKDDPFVAIADRATEQFSLSTAPGGFLVDLIPASTYSSSSLWKYPSNADALIGYSASHTSMVSRRRLPSKSQRVGGDSARNG